MTYWSATMCQHHSLMEYVWACQNNSRHGNFFFFKRGSMTRETKTGLRCTFSDTGVKIFWGQDQYPKHSKWRLLNTLKYRLWWVHFPNTKAERRVPIWAIGKRNARTEGRRVGLRRKILEAGCGSTYLKYQQLRDWRKENQGRPGSWSWTL